jgi:acyl CoA:acetate/3-ketoacid CoA transferase alpha subunit
MHQLLTAGAEGAVGRLVQPGADKQMTAAEAIGAHVRPGMTVGMGGQNINRCPMTLVHEVVRQGIGDLSIVGCNLSLPLDILVAAGLVAHTEQGSGNLEKYGVLFTWRRAIEAGVVTTTDHSHLTMASRFLAGAMGLPFMPTRSLLGTDLLDGLLEAGVAAMVEDPFGSGPMVLLRAQCPDVSLIHVSRADAAGNCVIDGVTSHEVDMVRASRATIVSAEEVLPAGAFDAEPERVTISSAYVTAVVEQRHGAFPTSVYRDYDYSEWHVRDYQQIAKAGDGVRAWLAENIAAHESFDGYLAAQDPEGLLRGALADQMGALL